MVENSKICKAFLWVYSVLTESVFFRFLLRAIGRLGTILRESAPGLFLCREKSIDDFAASSKFYRGLACVLRGIYRPFRKLYMYIRRYNEESINRRFFEGIVQNAYVLRPETLLGLGVLVLFLVPHTFWNNLYAAGMAAALVGVYILCILSGKSAFGKSVFGIWFPFLLFMGATALSTLGSPAMGDSIRTLAFFITAFLFSLLVSGMLSSYEKTEKFIGYMLLAVGVTAVYAIYQRIMGVKADASLTDLSLNAGMPGRVFATLGNPNNYAEFLMLMLPFGFAYSVNQPKTGRRLLGLFAVLLGFVALLLTYSRSGWLAFAVSALVFVALYNWKLLPILCLVGTLAVPLLPASILNRILTIGNLADSSSSYRIDIWTGSLRMLRDGYWFAGTGLGAEAFTSVYPAYAIGASRVAPHTHMQFMEILAEMGIIGLFALLWFSISLVRRTAVAAGHAEKRLKTVLCAAAASMAGITAIGFAEYTWFYPRVMFAFFITAGIAMAAVRIAGKTNE